MKRLTNDNPQDNVSSAMNLFYVKDGWTWVSGGGPAPDYADVSLCDYVRQIAKEHSLDIAQSDDDDSISLEMSELLFDGTYTIEGIVATLYTAGWAFAELRERLKSYEGSGLSPEKVATLVTPPNYPLTLEELRKMDGEPIFLETGWVDTREQLIAEWEILVEHDEDCFFFTRRTRGFSCKNYGKTWLAYRRRPEEGVHGTAD